MNIKWILGMGSMGALVFFAQPADAHHCGTAGGRDMQMARVCQAGTCGRHTAKTVGERQAKNNPTPADTAKERAAKTKNPAAENALKPQTTCPVMKGAAINPDLYVDYEGKRIHVCCAGCDHVVKTDPEAAIATLAEQGQAPRQALCPVMNRPIDTEQYVDHEGQRIYVCCAGCVARVEDDPEAVLEKLHEQGVAPARAGVKPEAEKPAHDHGHHHHH